MTKGRILALVLGAVAIWVAKRVMDQRSRYEGLTEAEMRAQLDERLPSRIPEDKRAVIADKVIEKMQARGVLRDETIDLTEPETVDV